MNKNLLFICLLLIFDIVIKNLGGWGIEYEFKMGKRNSWLNVNEMCK